MDKKSLKYVFDKAREGNHKFVIVHLFTPAGEEFICIPSGSFDEKEKSYNNAYDENLIHVMNKEVRIVGLSFGDGSELDNLI